MSKDNTLATVNASLVIPFFLLCYRCYKCIINYKNKLRDTVNERCYRQIIKYCNRNGITMLDGKFTPFYITDDDINKIAENFLRGNVRLSNKIAEVNDEFQSEMLSLSSGFGIAITLPIAGLVMALAVPAYTMTVFLISIPVILLSMLAISAFFWSLMRVISDRIIDKTLQKYENLPEQDIVDLVRYNLDICKNMSLEFNKEFNPFEYSRTYPRNHEGQRVVMLDINLENVEPEPKLRSLLIIIYEIV